MGSNGSVIPFFMKKKSEGFLPITDPNMTRFNISLDEGVDMVLHALGNALGGEIFIPKIRSYKITDVATAIAPDTEQRVVGIRPGEKVHEEMITPSDSYLTYDVGRYYVILPTAPNRWTIEEFKKTFNATKVPVGFHYNSGDNDEWEDVQSLRNLIKEHVDPTFVA
jgi:FlaA1/EpsC-like NDP-sugar epimerase